MTLQRKVEKIGHILEGDAENKENLCQGQTESGLNSNRLRPEYKSRALSCSAGYVSNNSKFTCLELSLD
jgi:hypothetical protein